MLTKGFNLEIKSLDEAGTFEGLASVYGNVDSYGDIVMPGAFTRTLKERGNECVVLNQHNQREPIGLGKLGDSEKGLTINGQLNLDVRCAQEAYSNLKKRIIKGLSIGYAVKRHEHDIEKNQTKLLDIDLYEVSLVTFPANPKALVGNVKSRDEIKTIRDFEESLRDLGFSRKEATAIASHGWTAIQRDAADDLPTAKAAEDTDAILALLQARTHQLNTRRLTWQS